MALQVVDQRAKPGALRVAAPIAHTELRRGIGAELAYPQGRRVRSPGREQVAPVPGHRALPVALGHRRGDPALAVQARSILMRRVNQLMWDRQDDRILLDALQVA